MLTVVCSGSRNVCCDALASRSKEMFHVELVVEDLNSF